MIHISQMYDIILCIRFDSGVDVELTVCLRTDTRVVYSRYIQLSEGGNQNVKLTIYKIANLIFIIEYCTKL